MEAECQPRRVDGRIQAVERTTEEARPSAASAQLLGRERHDFLRRAESRRSFDLVLPRPHLRLGRGDPQHRSLAEPRVHLLHLAPRADAAHGILRGAAHGERPRLPRLLPERRRVAPQRLAEAAVPAARPMSAEGALEDEHVELGLKLPELPGRPQAEVPAADDDDDVSALVSPARGACDVTSPASASHQPVRVCRIRQAPRRAARERCCRRSRQRPRRVRAESRKAAVRR